MFGKSAKASPKRRLSGRYRGLIVLLCVFATGGAIGVFAAASASRYVIDAGLVLAIAGAMLFGLAAATEAPALASWWAKLVIPGRVVACAGLVLTVVDLVMWRTGKGRLSLEATSVAAGGCVLTAGVAGLVAHYFGNADATQLPEAPALQRAGRTTVWLFVLIVAELGALRLGQRVAAWSLHGVILAVAALACVELLFARRADGAFPVDLRVLDALGQRANILSSLLDTAQKELGIDLRSTWALTVARRFLEPLVLTLCILGWLSTGVTIIDTNEVGLVERFGTVADGPPLAPGLHVHLPWPIDRVHRIDAMQVRALTIGHEEARSGPEDVLWARQHTANEYTLLLGDGHDLITVDAQLQYRIRDARAYLYGTQNPDDALRAIGYRAVMRATVSRTLGEALSENVATLTASIQKTIQVEADRRGLGIDVVGFTIGAMHPPVAVAPDYQGVVSAELAKVTAIVEAETARNQAVPAAQAAALVETSAANADAAATIAKAAGEAWAFRTLEAQYKVAPDEYRFRRRLETLEQTLASRHFTIVDARIMRDGGELWLTQ